MKASFINRVPQTLATLFAGTLLTTGALLTTILPSAQAATRPDANVATLSPADMQQLLQLQPRTAADFYDLGVSLQGSGDLPGALKNFTKAIELDPNADHYFARGLAYADLGDNQKAIIDYNTAIRLDREFAAAYYNRGAAYMALQQLQLAVADFSQAIKYQPEFVAAYYSRGMAYYDLGQVALARQDYSQAQRMSPSTTAAFYDQVLRPATGGN